MLLQCAYDPNWCWAILYSPSRILLCQLCWLTSNQLCLQCCQLQLHSCLIGEVSIYIIYIYVLVLHGMLYVCTLKPYYHTGVLILKQTCEVQEIHRDIYILSPFETCMVFYGLHTMFAVARGISGAACIFTCKIRRIVTCTSNAYKIISW